MIDLVIVGNSRDNLIGAAILKPLAEDRLKEFLRLPRYC